MGDLDALIEKKANRHLHYLDNFEVVESKHEVPGCLTHIVPREGERLIGYYRNSDAATRGCIIVSTKGLYLCSTRFPREPDFLAYGEMATFVAPPHQEKHSADSLGIILRNGVRRTLFVDGGDEKIRDVWGMLSFLKQVSRIYKKRE